MKCQVSSGDLTDVVNEIFSAMAGMHLAPSPGIVAFDRRGGYVVSSVQIVGDWQGAVQLDIDLALARQACANQGLPRSRIEHVSTAARSLVLHLDRSVPFGRYWRRRPFVFSLVPRCHGLCGSAN